LKQVVLATRNLGKIKEFERMLRVHLSEVEVLGLDDFPDLPDVAETGKTFVENALLKARVVSSFTKLPAIADDSGLCVDALGGEPGIYSARYAGLHGDDAANIAKLLAKLVDVPKVDRGAQFRCVIAFHLPDGLAGLDLTQAGELKGEISMSPRGGAGFGYDPIFQPEGVGLTLGEFGFGEKDKISHRGKALRAIAPKLTALL
jgi:XTP/dITP diphosphohydrolase